MGHPSIPGVTERMVVSGIFYGCQIRRFGSSPHLHNRKCAQNQIYLIYLFFTAKNASNAAGRGRHHSNHGCLKGTLNQIYLIYLFLTPKNASNAAGHGRHHSNHGCLKGTLNQIYLIYLFLTPGIIQNTVAVTGYRYTLGLFHSMFTHEFVVLFFFAPWRGPCCPVTPWQICSPHVEFQMEWPTTCWQRAGPCPHSLVAPPQLTNLTQFCRRCWKPRAQTHC